MSDTRIHLCKISIWVCCNNLSIHLHASDSTAKLYWWLKFNIFFLDEFEFSCLGLITHLLLAILLSDICRCTNSYLNTIRKEINKLQMSQLMMWGRGEVMYLLETVPFFCLMLYSTVIDDTCLECDKRDLTLINRDIQEKMLQIHKCVMFYYYY